MKCGAEVTSMHIGGQSKRLPILAYPKKIANQSLRRKFTSGRITNIAAILPQAEVMTKR
jgi:hypothetical protein